MTIHSALFHSNVLTSWFVISHLPENGLCMRLVRSPHLRHLVTFEFGRYITIRQLPSFGVLALDNHVWRLEWGDLFGTVDRCEHVNVITCFVTLEETCM